jgi:hypothetical protein
MRLSLFGKLVVLLVIASALYYAWRYLVPTGTRTDLQQRADQIVRRGTGGGRPTPPARDPTEPAAPPPPAQEAPPSETPNTGSADILFVSTPAKRGWVDRQVEKFQRARGGQPRIVVQDMASRDAMQAILNGKVQPVLWSPGETVWPARLAEVWRERHAASILDTANPSAYRVVLRSPLVFLTTRRKAEFLRPLLGGTRPWAALRELSLGHRSAPWGPLRFSHADPVTSSSGMLTFALILEEYNAEGRDPDEVARSAGFARYLGELERSLVYDEPARKGTTALAKAFLSDPSRYDVITAYESHALEAAPRSANLAVIYPNPTAFSDHAVVLLSGSWVTPEQRAGGQAFLEFLSSEEAQADALQFSFRPGVGAASLLNQRLSALRAQGFKPNVPSIELPPYAALNDAAYVFHERIAKVRTQ